MAETRTAEVKLSKMQKIRKRELRKAISLLHDRLKQATGDSSSYGLRLAISVLGDMRKEIDAEVSRG